VLTKETKTNIIETSRVHPKDTGSPEVQISLITERINYLTEHFSKHKHDFHSKTGLMRLVGKRKRLLEYLKNKDVKRYEAVINRLKLRK